MCTKLESFGAAESKSNAPSSNRNNTECSLMAHEEEGEEEGEVEKIESIIMNDFVFGHSTLSNFIFPVRRWPKPFGKFVCQDNILINKRQSFFLFRSVSGRIPLRRHSQRRHRHSHVFVCAIVKNSPWSAEMEAWHEK